MDNIIGKISGLLGDGEIKEKVEEIVEKIKGSDDLIAKFKADPEKTIESLIGIDIPDEIAAKVIDGVKGALASGKLGDLLGKAVDLLDGDNE